MERGAEVLFPGLISPARTTLALRVAGPSVVGVQEMGISTVCPDATLVPLAVANTASLASISWTV